MQQRKHVWDVDVAAVRYGRRYRKHNNNNNNNNLKMHSLEMQIGADSSYVFA